MNSGIHVTPVKRSCPQCAGDDGVDLELAPAPWTIVRCRECSFVYMTSGPSYADLSETLAWSQSYKNETDRRTKKRPVFYWFDQKTRWRLHIFPRPETWRYMSKLVHKGAVVDIGCSNGANLLRLPETVTPFGVEIGKARAEESDNKLRARGGMCLHAPATEGLAQFEDEKFSGAMLNSFLEHENAPAPLLSVLYKKLTIGGVAVVKIPNFASWNAAIMKSAWCGVRIPDHVNYFTPKSLAAMAEKAGFVVTFPRFANLPTNDNFWAFLRKGA